MRIAIITASVGDIDLVKDIPQQITTNQHTIHVKYYNENNLPFPLPNLSNRLKSKYIKIQTHKFLPDYDLYIWIDGRVEVLNEKFVQSLLDALGNTDGVFVTHPQRSNVFEEINYILENIGSKYIEERYGDQEIEKELEFFQQQKQVSGIETTLLLASGIFMRRNNLFANNCFDKWWDKVIQYSVFDQAMLSYALNETRLDINVFGWNEVEGVLFKLGKHRENPINLTQKETFNKIKKHLSTHTPFALIRYGDGEAMMLDDDKELHDFVFNRQFGSGIAAKKHIRVVQEHLIKAYQQADVIGRPTARHDQLTDHWGKANSILSQYVDLKRDSCTIDFFYDCLNNKDLNQSQLDSLLMNRDTLFYINSNNLDQQLKERYNIRKIESFIIAPEMKFSPDYQGESHLNQFNQIKEWIQQLNCQGALCLVGAGVLGKIYNIWFKQQGGISLDIGGVFDLWAGKNTRGKGRGPGAIDNTYKL